MGFFRKDTEVSIWGKSRERLRISMAEMPNVRVCSADKVHSNRAVTGSCDGSPVEQRRTQLSKPGHREKRKPQRDAQEDERGAGAKPELKPPRGWPGEAGGASSSSGMVLYKCQDVAASGPNGKTTKWQKPPAQSVGKVIINKSVTEPQGCRFSAPPPLKMPQGCSHRRKTC